MGNIYSIWAKVKPAPGPERKKGGGREHCMEDGCGGRWAGTAGSEEEDAKAEGRERQGKGRRESEIPSSGFLLRPLLKVNEGCVQSSDTDYITAPLISTNLSAPAHVCTYAALRVDAGALSPACVHRRQRTWICLHVRALCSIEHLSGRDVF